MLNFNLKTKFLAGYHQIERLPYELFYKNKSNILLVCDISGDYSGVTDKIRKILQKNYLNVYILILNSNVYAALEHIDKVVVSYRKNNCDCIIALGNERIITNCKAAKAVIDNNAISFLEVRQYADGVDKVFLTVIPTTIDCNNALTGNVYIWDATRNEVCFLLADQLLPNLMVIDEKICDDLPVNDILENFILALGMASCAVIDKSLSNLIKVMGYTAIDLIDKVYQNIHHLKSINTYKIILALSLSNLIFSKIEDNLIADITQAISIRYSLPYRKVFMCLFLPYFVRVFGNNDEEADELLLNVITPEEYVTIPKDKRVDWVIQVFEERIRVIYDLFDIKPSLISLGVNINEIPSLADEVLIKNNEIDNLEKRWIIESIITDSL